jgi:hypothetical protein
MMPDSFYFCTLAAGRWLFQDLNMAEGIVVPDLDFLPTTIKERAAAIVHQWREFCASRSAALVSFSSPFSTE